jgi:hydrogenase nickel incorporation protein HypA/HybF
VHELSIAEAVAAVALRHAGGRRVQKVEVRVGHLRQVVPSALEFAFELVSDGTPLEGAELIIEEVPAWGRCPACRSETTMAAFPLQCAACGGFDIELIAGGELLVEALELEEQMTTEGMSHGC